MTALEFSNQIYKVSGSLRPMALNLTRDAEEAKDLIQDTMLKALTNRTRFKTGTNLKAWLYTIMRNTFINNYNKITKRSVTVDTDEYLQYFNSNRDFITYNDAPREFMRNDITTAINKLQDEQRVPFLMYYIGYKYLEIAEKLHIPIGTVKNRIHMARKELKQVLSLYAPADARD